VGGGIKVRGILTIDTTLIGRIILVGTGHCIGVELLVLVLVLLQAKHLLPGLEGVHDLGLVLAGRLGWGKANKARDWMGFSRGSLSGLDIINIYTYPEICPFV